MLDKSLLVRVLGYRAAFLHGDPLVLDRWRFVCQNLPVTCNGEKLFDVGCGTGAFTIGAAKRGYEAIGLSWDERNQRVAGERAKICAAERVSFPMGDARMLDKHAEYTSAFDYVLSLENIEHVLDDRKLMRDLAACLKPGGWLILSTPCKNYRAVTPEDNGPFERKETGWHVRRGYTAAMLRELAADAGLEVDVIGSCSGFFSQKLTWLLRRLGVAGWLLILPLRLLPLLLDRAMRRIFGYPDFSVTLIAYKPRFGQADANS